ncbi:hypothetical protein CCICO_10190 [Corynebacterium ciconiae DSM 44920]|uniref:hypothetical protein n=1 Tax=Corynebacterium ciconiae TaxID=227319 RepID=UPI000360A098|nr:hypothetical protein [Corynebacterium ciconiae]WKD62037.1 hypothetical protein CCICO_10190 [Corynebacterium ciconiae DSM 44920]
MTNSGLTLDQLRAEIDRANPPTPVERASVLLAATDPIAPDWEEADYAQLHTLLADLYAEVLSLDLHSIEMNRAPSQGALLRQLNHRQLAVAMVLGRSSALLSTQAWSACTDFFEQSPTFTQRKALLEREKSEALRILEVFYTHYTAAEQNAAEQQRDVDKRQAEERAAEAHQQRELNCLNSMADYFGDQAYESGSRMAEFPHDLDTYFAPLATADAQQITQCATLLNEHIWAEARGNEMIPPAEVPEYAARLDRFVLANSAGRPDFSAKLEALRPWLDLIPLLPAPMVSQCPALTRYVALGEYVDAQARNPDDIPSVLPLFETYADATLHFNDYKRTGVVLVQMCQLAKALGSEYHRQMLDKALPILHDACFTEHVSAVATQYIYLVRESVDQYHNAGNPQAALQEADNRSGMFDIDQLPPAAATQLAYVYEHHAALLHQLYGPRASAPQFKKTLRAFRRLGMDADAHRVKQRFTAGS